MIKEVAAFIILLALGAAAQSSHSNGASSAVGQDGFLEGDLNILTSGQGPNRCLATCVVAHRQGETFEFLSAQTVLGQGTSERQAYDFANVLCSNSSSGQDSLEKFLVVEYLVGPKKAGKNPVSGIYLKDFKFATPENCKR